MSTPAVLHEGQFAGHVSRAIAVTTDVTLYELSHQPARLEAAAGELAMTDAAVGEIAQACGFYDQAHLTREFRRRFDETPRGYRNRHRSR